MARRVGENRLHLRDRQPEISRDVRFVDAGFPILNDVFGGHTGPLQHGAATLHAKPYFDEGAIRPIHNDSRFPLPFWPSLRLLKIDVFASFRRSAAVVFALVSHWGGGRRVSTLSIRSSSAAMRMPISWVVLSAV